MAKTTASISSSIVIDFLQDYFNLHDVPFSIRVDPASCYTSHDLKPFFGSNSINLIFCTVGDHRFIISVEKFVRTVKLNLLAMAKEK